MINNYLKLKPGVLKKVFLPVTYVTLLVWSSFGVSSANSISLHLSERGIMAPREVRGNVADPQGNPLVGVSVSVKDGTGGTMTDLNGNFTITVDEDAVVLVFSYIGFGTREISVTGSEAINVIMTPDVSNLDQVVVIGYGTQKKRDITGSVASIDGSDISQQAVTNPLKALTGLTAGAQTLENSGAPGSRLNVLIRGSNSVLGGNEPLYVVDGFPYEGGIDNLNPNDIQSIEILKDASATAIYGSRGSNGVVMITTKQGRAGKTSVEYDGYVGVQTVTKKLDLLDAKEYATLANVRAANDGVSPFFTQDEINSFGKGTDWQDEIFRTAAIQNHSLRILGGNEKTTFGISGNYLDQQGIIIGSKYNQEVLKLDLSHQLSNDWKINFNSNLSRQAEYNRLNSDNQERGIGVLSGALVAPPTVPVKDEEGDYTNVRAYPFTPDILENPVATALERERKSVKSGTVSNLSVDWQIFSDLKFRSSIGLQYEVTRDDNYGPHIFQQSATGSGSIAYSELMHLVNENIFTYSRPLNSDNRLEIMAGLTSEQTIQKGASASSSNFPNDLLGNNSLQSGATFGTPTSFYSKYNILSGLGRINYAYKDKILLTASLRADGSSRFGKSNKWGYFPSFAAAWRLSQEEFLINSSSINDFKLRASWGQTGNTAVNPYQSLNILSSMQTVFDKNLFIGIAPGSIKPNPDLKWEVTSQFDVGADLSLFNNGLSFTIDYYHKETKDLLASIPLPSSSGYVTQAANIGSVQNQGIEVSLNTSIIRNNNFMWSLGGTFTLNRNKVKSLAGDADVFGASLGNALPAMSLVRVGESIGVFYGLVEDGLTDQGDIKYVDQDHNGEINSNDRVVIGNPNPSYIFGINTNLSLGNFDLSLILNGMKKDILAYNLSSIANGFYFGENQLKDVLGNYWTADNPDPDAKYPRVSSSTRYQGSDRYVKNGSYIRLQNVQLAYTFKEIFHSNIERMQVYLSAQNLLTITPYKLYSPVINTSGGGISKGIDYMGYPDARTFLIGLKINL